MIKINDCLVEIRELCVPDKICLIFKHIPCDTDWSYWFNKIDTTTTVACYECDDRPKFTFDLTKLKFILNKS